MISVYKIEPSYVTIRKHIHREVPAPGAPMVPTPMHVDMFLSVCYQASCHAHGITWFMLKNKAFYCIINNIKCIYCMEFWRHFLVTTALFASWHVLKETPYNYFFQEE